MYARAYWRTAGYAPDWLNAVPELPEFVSYLGERGVLCVGNVSHFCTPCTPVSTFDLTKCSEKISSRLSLFWLK